MGAKVISPIILVGTSPTAVLDLGACSLVMCLSRLLLCRFNPHSGQRVVSPAISLGDFCRSFSILACKIQREEHATSTSGYQEQGGCDCCHNGVSSPLVIYKYLLGFRRCLGGLRLGGGAAGVVSCPGKASALESWFASSSSSGALSVHDVGSGGWYD